MAFHIVKTASRTQPLMMMQRINESIAEPPTNIPYILSQSNHIIGIHPKHHPLYYTVNMILTLYNNYSSTTSIARITLGPKAKPKSKKWT
jgi:hypothetical protein